MFILHILEKLFYRAKNKRLQESFIGIASICSFHLAEFLLAKSYSHLGEAYASISLFHLAELWLTKNHSNLDKANSDAFEKEVRLYRILPAVDHGPG